MIGKQCSEMSRRAAKHNSFPCIDNKKPRHGLRAAGAIRALPRRIVLLGAFLANSSSADVRSGKATQDAGTRHSKRN